MFQLFYPNGNFSVLSPYIMQTSDTHSLKHTINKWLLALTLLVSVFAFSGLSISSRAVQSPTQTTWIIQANKPVVKGIRFSTQQRDFISSGNKYCAAVYINSLSQLHSKMSATRLKLCLGYNLFNTNKIFFRLNKTI